MNYTWATNLLKTAQMQTGAVSYHDNKKVVKINVDKNKDIVRAVMKTKSEGFPDFEKDYHAYIKEVEREKNSVVLEEKKKLAAEEKAAKDAIADKNQEWDDFFGAEEDEDKVFAGGDNTHLEDDFM